MTFYGINGNCSLRFDDWNKKAALCTAGNNYHCLLNDLGTYGEICVPSTWIQPNLCPVYNTKVQQIDVRLCKYEYGKCPLNAYLSDKVYQYSACFHDDNTATDSSSTLRSTTKAESDPGLPPWAVAMSIVLPLGIVILALVIALLVMRSRRRKKKKSNQDEEEPMLPDEKDPESEIQKHDEDNTFYDGIEAVAAGLKMLTQYGVVILVGVTGAGKTKCGLELLSMVRKVNTGERKYKCHILRNFDDFEKFASSKVHYCLFLDDCLDRWSYSGNGPSIKNDIIRLENVFTNYIRGKSAQVVLTVNVHTWNRFAKFFKGRNFFRAEHIISVGSLSYETKMEVLKKHLSLIGEDTSEEGQFHTKENECGQGSSTIDTKGKLLSETMINYLSTVTDVDKKHRTEDQNDKQETESYEKQDKNNLGDEQDKKQSRDEQDKKNSGDEQDRQNSEDGQGKKKSKDGQGKNNRRSKQDKKNSGDGQDKKNSGDEQDKKKSGEGQGKKNSGSKQDKKKSGDEQDKKNNGDEQDKKNSGDEQNKKNSGDEQDKKNSGDEQDKKNSGDEQDKKKSGEGQGKKNSGSKQDKKKSGDEQDKKNSGDEQDKKNSGDEQNKKNSGDEQDKKNSGDEQDKKNSGSKQNKKNSRGKQDKKNSGSKQDKKKRGGGPDTENSGEIQDKENNGDEGNKNKTRGTSDSAIGRSPINDDSREIQGNDNGGGKDCTDVDSNPQKLKVNTSEKCQGNTPTPEPSTRTVASDTQQSNCQSPRDLKGDTDACYSGKIKKSTSSHIKAGEAPEEGKNINEEAKEDSVHSIGCNSKLVKQSGKGGPTQVPTEENKRERRYRIDEKMMERIAKEPLKVNPKVSILSKKLFYLGFPEACALYSRDDKIMENGEEFFKDPIKFLSKRFSEWRDSKEIKEREKYVTLVYMLLNGGYMDIRSIKGELLNVAKSFYKDGYKINEDAVKEGVAVLLRSYCVEKSPGCFEFQHEIIEYTLLSVAVSKHPKQTFEYCDLNVLKRYMITKKNEKQEGELKVPVDSGFFELLAHRFVMSAVSLENHRCMEDERFKRKYKTHPGPAV